MDEPSNPHDKLFEETFSRVEFAAAELRAILDPRLSAHLDWSTLELASGDDDRVGQGERSHDLLFRVRQRDDLGSALICVLFEHQRTSDPNMPLRLLEYMVRIWGRTRREVPRGSASPPIIPVMLSHAPGGWRAPIRFAEMFGVDGAGGSPFKRFVPDFSYVVDDLSKIDDESLRARNLPNEVTETLWAFRDGPRGKTVSLAGISTFAVEIELVSSGAGGQDALWRIMGYLSISAGKRSPALQTLLAALSDAGPATQRAAMNNLEKFAEKYRLAGREEGREEGLRNTLRSLLSQKFGEVDAQLVARIEHLSSAALDEALGRILTADSVEAVLGE